MSRERTTWNRSEIAKQAAMPKQADPYLMNQPEHAKAQPAADAYVTGDPSSFGEDVHPSAGTWEAEYSGGAVKRNEIGMPEMRGDTFNHAEKTASEDVLVKKAQLCVRVARLMLPKAASAESVEDQGLALMHLPDAELINTFNRLAQDDPQQQGQTQEQQAQQQKQGGEMPPQFKENAEKKKEEAAEKKDDGQSQQKQAQQDQIAVAVKALQAGDTVAANRAIQAAIQSAAHQIKQANDQQQLAQGQQPQQQQAQMDQQAQMQQQAQMDQQAQMQQQMAQMVEQAAQQMAQAQQPQQQVAQGQTQQPQMAQGQPPQQQQAQGQQLQQPTADDMLLDQMLMDMPGAQAPAETDIELEAPSMDTGDGTLGPEDAQLMQLFANGDEAQQAQQAQDTQQGGQQQKQAGVRTASTRTVGTRPSQGVSRVGGSGTPSSGGGRDLSSIWNSAPDVSQVFGIPKS